MRSFTIKNIPPPRKATPGPGDENLTLLITSDEDKFANLRTTLSIPQPKGYKPPKLTSNLTGKAKTNAIAAAKAARATALAAATAAVPLLREASCNLINLLDATVLEGPMGLIENALIAPELIKQCFTNASMDNYVQNFHNIDFNSPIIPGAPVINIINEVLKLWSTPVIPTPLPGAVQSVLMNDTVQSVLMSAPGKLDISTVPGVSPQSIINLAKLVVLNRILQATILRFGYKEAETKVATPPPPPGKKNPTLPTNLGKGYGESKPSLIKACGLYCAYCESPLTDGITTDVEHKLPKGIFKEYLSDAERNWGNFVLACEVCNTSCKGSKFVDIRVKRSKKGKESTKVTEFDGTKYPVTSSEITVYLPIDHNENIVNAKGLYPFTVGARVHVSLPAVSNTYKILKKEAEENTVWADIRNFKALSFKVYDYSLHDFKKASNITISLNDIGANAHLEFLSGEKPGDNTIRLLGLEFNKKYENIAIQPVFNGNPTPLVSSSPSYADNESKDSAKNTIDLCGLDEIASEKHYTDQRFFRRTKAWLHAMKQLKALQRFHRASKDLAEYYSYQLDPVNMVPPPVPVPSTSNVGFKDYTATPAPQEILLETISCTLTLKTLNIPDGFVDISGGASKPKLKIASVSVNVIPKSDYQDTDQYHLSGKIITEATKRYITGTLSVTLKSPAGAPPPVPPSEELVIFLQKEEVTLNSSKQTEIQVNSGQGKIFSTSTPKDQALEMLEKWGQKRDKLIDCLDKMDNLLTEIMLDNIIDMVRIGGFYSTWVRTFQKICKDNKMPRFDVDLVRRLDLKAQTNKDDAFQFHGTDAAEIITLLD
jgi:hypothetical protein